MQAVNGKNCQVDFPKENGRSLSLTEPAVLLILYWVKKALVAILLFSIFFKRASDGRGGLKPIDASYDFPIGMSNNGIRDWLHIL